MSDNTHKDVASEPIAMTYGMSSGLRTYTIEELNARIDEAEEEIDRGEGKSFDEMMAGFREKLLWLK